MLLWYGHFHHIARRHRSRSQSGKNRRLDQKLSEREVPAFVHCASGFCTSAASCAWAFHPHLDRAGWPILSGPEFIPDTPDVRQSFFANLVQVSTELREGQVTLDAVSWPASSPIAKLNSSDLETPMRGTSTAAQASARSVAMPVLAHISGGEFTCMRRT